MEQLEPLGLLSLCWLTNSLEIGCLLIASVSACRSVCLLHRSSSPDNIRSFLAFSGSRAQPGLLASMSLDLNNRHNSSNTKHKKLTSNSIANGAKDKDKQPKDKKQTKRTKHKITWTENIIKDTSWWLLTFGYGSRLLRSFRSLSTSSTPSKHQALSCRHQYWWPRKNDVQASQTSNNNI